MEPIVNDQGNGGAAPAAPSVDTTTPAPNGQEGSQGAPAAQPQRDNQETVASLRKQLAAVQKQLVDGRQMGGQQPGGQDIDLSTPEGQYMVALEIGTSRLRNELEPIYSMYSEIPAEEIARVRSNPWAFAKPDVYARADWQQAKWQVEAALAERAEQLAKAEPAAPAVNPATISNNPAPAGNDPAAQVEDVDPWSMPMDELEKLAMKEKAKLSSKS